jgi:hypothetical protein
MNSYITLTEANRLYPLAADYSSSLQGDALSASYGLVNSFVSSELRIPAISPDGQSPSILKIAQLKFYKYILEFSNMGQTDENQELYDKTAEMLSKITQNELTVPDVQTFPTDIGWHLINQSIANGSAFIRGGYPSVRTQVNVNFYHTGSAYPTASYMKFVRTDSDSVIATMTGSYDWASLTLDDVSVELRYDGKFSASDSFGILGIPGENIVVEKDTLKQRPINLLAM